MNKWIMGLAGAGTIITAGGAGLAAVACGSSGGSDFSKENLSKNMYLTISDPMSSIFIWNSELKSSGNDNLPATAPGIAAAFFRSTDQNNAEDVVNLGLLDTALGAAVALPDTMDKVLTFKGYSSDDSKNGISFSGSTVVKTNKTIKAALDGKVAGKTWVSYDLILDFSKITLKSSLSTWTKDKGLPSGSFTIHKAFDKA